MEQIRIKRYRIRQIRRGKWSPAASFTDTTISFTVREYQNGRPFVEKEYEVHAADTILKHTRTMKNDYDAKGHVIRSMESEDTNTVVNTYAYDKSGNLYKHVTADLKGVIQRISTNEYAGGKKVSSCTVNPHGDTVESYIYQYSGDMMKEILIKGQGVDTTWYKGGRMVEMLMRGYSDHKTIFRDNKDGKMVESLDYERKRQK